MILFLLLLQLHGAFPIAILPSELCVMLSLDLKKEKREGE